MPLSLFWCISAAKAKLPHNFFESGGPRLVSLPTYLQTSRPICHTARFGGHIFNQRRSFRRINLALFFYFTSLPYVTAIHSRVDFYLILSFLLSARSLSSMSLPLLAR